MQQQTIHSEKIHKIEHGIYIGDAIYGANDGIITTFAVVSGAAGAALSSGLIIILGLASLVADAVSMGLSNFLAIKSKLDYQIQERKREETEVELFPEKEKEEVREILQRWNVPDDKLGEFVTALTKDKKQWVDFMMKEELGIIEEPSESPLKHSLVTTVAFIVAGFLPLIPYVFGVAAESQFFVSIAATGISLFTVGALRTLITGTKWFYSGLQMLSVGGAAALIAYFVGSAVKTFFGITI